MKKILQNSLFFILGFVPFCSVAKADTVASPLSYASNVWVGRSEAVIRVLDKLESRSTVFTIPVGEKQQYKTLTIEVKACVIRPPLMASDSAAFVDLVDTHPDTPHFAAWIFQEEPAISVYENPVYNVAVVQCSGNRLIYQLHLERRNKIIIRNLPKGQTIIKQSLLMIRNQHHKTMRHLWSNF